MIQSTLQQVKEHLLKNPGKYITRNELYNLTMATKSLHRALQDLTASGRAEFNGIGYRINQ